MTHHPSGRRRRLLVVAAALLVTAATPHVAPSSDTSPATSPAGATRTADNVAASIVTLVTGDKVTVAPGVGDGPGTITVQGPDGEPTGARVLTVGGDTYVYPDSARPYLASGALDDQLFDISRLVADGYDDAALKHLPLIVTYGGKAASASTLRSRAVAMPGDVTDVRPLTSVPAAGFAKYSLTGRTAELAGDGGEFEVAGEGCPRSRCTDNAAGVVAAVPGSHEAAAEWAGGPNHRAAARGGSTNPAPASLPCGIHSQELGKRRPYAGRFTVYVALRRGPPGRCQGGSRHGKLRAYAANRAAMALALDSASSSACWREAS